MTGRVFPDVASPEASASPPEANATPPESLLDDDTEILRRLIEGTVESTGEAFFQSLVRNLSLAVGSACCFVAEFAGSQTRVRTLAFWNRGRFLDNVEFDLAGTPCEDVVRGELCHYPRGVQQRFPADRPLREMDIESYLGVPLKDREGHVLGHLALLDSREMSDEPRRLSVFRIFASRAAAELERVRAEQQLRASEQRFRDLYEQAPIAYIYEDTESRFVSANRAATKLLGLKPEEVRGTLGLSLIAPTPENQERVHRAIGAIQKGEEQTCIELELRRKDDGRPVWVQWWSKPEPDGKFTRTMIVDITDRVLAEQDRNRLQQQNLYLREEIKSEYNFEEIIGRSGRLADVLDKVTQVAPTDSTVLILGETGTGKELIARAVHNLSKRKDKPLIKLNCSALPSGLIESELFGHEKGAFTGATEKRIGRFELAHGGTIFLDEIGDLQADAQVKLLRVLQEHEFERLGSSRTIKVDVRVIAATNRNLITAVAAGTFRQDLYYRLSVFPIGLPPLRARQEDVSLLVHYFLNRFATKIGRRITGVSHDTMKRLTAYSWPGNVRELENVIERAVILTPGGDLQVGAEMLVETAADGGATATPAPPQPPISTHKDGAAVTSSMDDIQRSHIVKVLEQTNWRIDGPQGAARLLNMNPSTLRSRLKKLGIQRTSGQS